MNNDQNNNLNGIITPESIISNDSTNNIQNSNGAFYNPSLNSNYKVNELSSNNTLEGNQANLGNGNKFIQS